MKFKIIYDSPGRLRVRCGQNVFSELQENNNKKYNYEDACAILFEITVYRYSSCSVY